MDTRETITMLQPTMPIPLPCPTGPVWVLPAGDVVPIQTFHETRVSEAMSAARMFRITTGRQADVLLVVPISA